ACAEGARDAAPRVRSDVADASGCCRVRRRRSRESIGGGLIGWRGRRRCTAGDGGALAPAAAGAALFLRRFLRLQHRRASFGRLVLEARPPFDERRRHFAALAAKREKIVRGAKTRMLEKTKRTRAGALL